MKSGEWSFHQHVYGARRNDAWIHEWANFADGQPFAPQQAATITMHRSMKQGMQRQSFSPSEVIQKHLPPGWCCPGPGEEENDGSPAFHTPGVCRPVLAIACTHGVGSSLSFENFQQGYGYVLYRTQINGPQHGALRIDQLRDFALVFANGRRLAVLDRRLNQTSADLDLRRAMSPGYSRRNLGRINYGAYLNDNRKGLRKG
jgi:beta-galactosidase